MMMKLFTLLSLVSMAFGQEVICEFAIVMYSNSTNDCFNGWPMKQTEALAGPILQSWQQKEYPQLIDESDECTSLVTLTLAEYNNKTTDEKNAYKASQENCGWNIGYDKNYAFCKDQGYREGWDIEYTNKIDPSTVIADYIPIGLPSLLLPEDPSPTPQEVVYEGNLHWYKTKYTEGWEEACVEGLSDGKTEGKAAGKSAREVGDDYHFAWTSGYKKGYNDASLGLTALHDPQGNRQLRSVERKMREQHANGYSEGYDEAMEAKKKRELSNVERHLPGTATCQQKCKTYWGVSSPTWNQWTQCKMIFPGACYGYRRRMHEEEWTQVATLPMDGILGGVDFKELLEHLLITKCAVEDVFFEVWKVCPATSA